MEAVWFTAGFVLGASFAVVMVAAAQARRRRAIYARRWTTRYYTFAADCERHDPVELAPGFTRCRTCGGPQ